MENKEGLIWYDGNLVDWKDAKLHVLTHGLHYASSVFEGERSYSGRIFKLHEHTERLLYSASELDFEIPYSIDEIKQASYLTLEKNNLVDAYIRPIAWRGAETVGVSAQNTKIHFAIAVWEWPSYFSPEDKLKGIRLTVSNWKRPSPDTIPCKAKAAGLYMICTLAKHKAEANGYADALMLDTDNKIAEATGANIFFISKGEIHTPIPDSFLDGITRRTVIEIAKSKNIKVHERKISPNELSDFEGCFLTGTAAEVTPVSQIDKNNYKVCETILELSSSYDSLVRKRKAA